MSDPQGTPEQSIPFPIVAPDDAKESNQPHDRSTIRKIEEYVDNKGRKVIAFTQVYGKSPEPPILKGVVTIVVRHPSGNPELDRQVSLEFPFPPTVQTPRSAFEKYDEVAKHYAEHWKQQQQEKARIIGARAMPNIVGADGKPVKFGEKS